MIEHSMEKGKIRIANQSIGLEIDITNHFRIENLEHRSINGTEMRLQPDSELFSLSIGGACHAASTFEITSISTGTDEKTELVSIMLERKHEGIKIRVCLMLEGGSLYLILQLALEREDGCPENVYLHLPFLAGISFGDSNTDYYFPANPKPKLDGSSVMQLHDDFPLPLGVFERDSGKGFSIEFPRPWGGLLHLWDQKRSHDFLKIKNLEGLKNHSILLRPGRVLTDVAELKFTAVCGGWSECFNLWREGIRSQYDFTQYKRPDLKWFGEALLQHFTYFYGKEAYDYEKGELQIDELLKQGKEFGGYDTVLLWHQYPRLGVDGRDQWDFFNDFPGGKDGIRSVVEKAHKNGVKVFLPFKPWDARPGESTDDITMKIAELTDHTNIDGIFFDTMDSVPDGLRESLDNVRAGIVFCTEIQPHKKKNIEMITGSWDQYWNTESMPETNLLRYVIPEHFSPVISRWHVGDKKDVLIKRAVFNGTGIVIWQDIFGAWLPYSKDQKEAIRKWKDLLKNNLSIFSCSRPIPLYPSLQQGLYCNMFPSDDGKSVIFTIYNDNAFTVMGDLFAFDKLSVERPEECWRGTEICVSVGKNGKNIVGGQINAKDILVIKLT